MTGTGWGALTIRFRLGAALALALLPIIILGAAQSVMAFRQDAEDRRLRLVAAAEDSAELARSRVESAAVALQILSPEAADLQCAPRLAQVLGKIEGYSNLVRLDAQGRVACAAATVRQDPGRAAWLARLRQGEPVVVVSVPAGVYGPEASLLTAVPTEDASGAVDGALVAAMSLSSFLPRLRQYDLPQGTELALVDGAGRFIVRSRPDAFAGPPPEGSGGAVFYRARDQEGRTRVFATAPMVASQVRLVLSAPDQGLFSWARLNPLSTVLLPLIAFIVALFAVWTVADQVVVRWLHYLQRIAAIYARGRFSVRARQIDRAPPEIRDLGRSLDAMAEAIVSRDQDLLQNLAQKDALMREIHHRVKNNLQVISSLLNMQQRSLTDPAARAAISDTRQRISAIALVYRALYQGTDLKRVDLKPFLEELTAQLLTSEGGTAIRTDFSADELIIDPDKLAPVALFAVEAISNAQKHAVRHGAQLLRIRFSLEGDEAMLEISDEGADAPPANLGEGVGRTLMTAFARQLRGRADVAPNGVGGVTARLVFPIPDDAPPSAAPGPPEGGAAAA
jgi:two-component sensor histidine kinase